jgi:dTDP-4-dehydrorhamnose reductase
VRAIAAVKPDVVVNCIGIVKQLDAAHDPVPSISVNALFPHRLAALVQAADARLLHVSTDCVFSGRGGGYTEADEPDPVDLYGRTKLLGEVVGAGALTVRTSIVGRELGTTQGLLEWFLAQSGPVRGYARAIFSGVTTEALAEVLAEIAAHHSALSGVWHVASEPITKLELLHRLAHTFGHAVAIEPDDRLAIDRSLDGSRFVAATGIETPSWDDMLAQLGGAVHAG